MSYFGWMGFIENITCAILKQIVLYNIALQRVQGNIFHCTLGKRDFLFNTIFPLSNPISPSEDTLNANKLCKP